MNEVTPIICFCGKRGTGKTYLAITMLRQCKRVMVWDVLYEFAPKTESAADVNAMMGEYTVVTDMAKLREAVQADTFKIAFRPDLKDDEKFQQQLTYFADLAIALKDVVLFFDEAQRSMTQRKVNKTIEYLIGISRHERVGLMFSTQRPQKINENAFDLMTDIFVFNLNKNSTIDYLEDNVGEDDLSFIRNFKPRQCWSKKL